MSKIIALHGFLGLPRDFKPLMLPHVVAPNIFNTTICPLTTWAKKFNRTIAMGNILLGYSMGARLALHCLLENPSRFKAAILISAHPGLSCEQQKLQRKKTDHEWRKKFLTWPWHDVMNKWDNLPVFFDSKKIVRNEYNFCRTSLALSLYHFSLARQKNLCPAINELSLPILWLSPEKESQKIIDLDLRHKHSNIIHIKHGGHRFIYEYPHLVSKYITSFLKNIF